MERSLDELSFAINLIHIRKSMDKETLIRLAQPGATALLAASICTLPITVKAYGDSITIKGDVTRPLYLKQGESNSNPLHVIICSKRPIPGQSGYYYETPTCK